MSTDIEHARTPCDGAAVVERHDMYYFDFVVFQVQTTLFSVPKNGFLDSNPGFFDNLAPIKSANAIANEADPIELMNVTAEYFKGLLLVIYPFKRTAETYEEWLGALDLATRWDLPDIRKKAIDALSKLNKTEKKSSVEIILLAKKYRIKEWLVESYVQLVRSDDLNLKTLRKQAPENTSLDWETMSRLFSARLELIQLARSHTSCPVCTRERWFCVECCKLQSTLNRIKAEVESTFEDELSVFPRQNAGIAQAAAEPLLPDPVLAFSSPQEIQSFDLPNLSHPTPSVPVKRHTTLSKEKGGRAIAKPAVSKQSDMSDLLASFLGAK